MSAWLTSSAFRAAVASIQRERAIAEAADAPTETFDMRINALYASQLPPEEIELKISGRRRIGVQTAAVARHMDPGLAPDAPFTVGTADQRAEMASIDVSDEVYDAAVERLNREAPDAPLSAQTEAVIRYVAYLLDTASPWPADAVRGAGAWFRCGAASVLAPYRLRRAV